MEDGSEYTSFVEDVPAPRGQNYHYSVYFERALKF